jgi:hypothetical protein
MTNVRTMIRPSLRVARLVYFTDLTRKSARIIPLGALCEITLPSAHGLALKARAELTPSETASVAPLLRESLAKPFTFLRDEFDLAWDEAEFGQALKFLGERHNASLSLLSPHDGEAEGSWHRWLTGEKEFEVRLGTAVEREFADLLKDTLPAPLPNDTAPKIQVDRKAS